MKRINNLEFLRTVGCVVIVLHHLLPRLGRINKEIYSNLLIYNTVKQGQLVVDLFFILSGFLFVYAGDFKNSLPDLIKKKIVRLYPVLFWVFFLTFVGDYFHITHFNLWTGLMATFGLYGTPLIIKGGAAGMAGQFWYCCSMMWTFLLFSYLLKNYQQKTVHLIFAILIFISYSVVIQGQNGYIGGGADNTLLYIGNTGLLRALGGIGLGYFIGRWYQGYTPVQRKYWQKGLITLMEFACIYIMLRYLIWHKLNYNNHIIFVIVFVITIVLFLRKEGYCSRLLDTSYLFLLSRYTYSIYMTHHLVFMCLQASLWKDINFVAVHPYLQIVIAMGGALLLGIVTYHTIEIPGKKLFTRYLLSQTKQTV